MTSKDQQARSELVRQAILDTALEIGIREGFEALSIRKIINKMRYSTGVIYHYFKDKQEIIDAIEKSETNRLRTIISGVLDNTQDIVHNMSAVFRRITKLAFEEPEKYNLIVLHKYSRHNEGKPEWLTYLSDGLREGMKKGLIREMDAEKAAFSIWSSFLGFNLMISRQVVTTMEETEAMLEVQLRIILKGVLNDEKIS